MNNDLQRMLDMIRQQLIRIKSSQNTTSDTWKFYLATLDVSIPANSSTSINFKFETSSNQDYIINCYILNTQNRYFGVSGQLSPLAGKGNFNKFNSVLQNTTSSTKTETIVAITTQPGMLNQI